MDKKPPPHRKITPGGVRAQKSIQNEYFPRKETSVLGLGDAIKRVTTAVGIKPCKACRKRAEKLNQLFPLRRGKGG
jgi:hypothetical protein